MGHTCGPGCGGFKKEGRKEGLEIGLSPFVAYASRVELERARGLMLQGHLCISFSLWHVMGRLLWDLKLHLFLS